MKHDGTYCVVMKLKNPACIWSHDFCNEIMRLIQKALVATLAAPEQLVGLLAPEHAMLGLDFLTLHHSCF